MNTMASKIGSKRMALIEALAANDRAGLTVPGICQASGVPKSTVPRIMADFARRGVVVEVGRKGKAPIYRLNRADPEVREIARACYQYSYRIVEEEQAEMAAKVYTFRTPAPEPMPMPVAAVSHSHGPLKTLMATALFGDRSRAAPR